MDISTYPNGEGQVVDVRGKITAADTPERIATAVERVIQRESPPW